MLIDASIPKSRVHDVLGDQRAPSLRHSTRFEAPHRTLVGVAKKNATVDPERPAEPVSRVGSIQSMQVRVLVDPGPSAPVQITASRYRAPSAVTAMALRSRWA